MTAGLVCITRDEEREVAEWVIYHRKLGFDRIVIYNHLSRDRTGAVAEAAGAEVIPWNDTKRPQGNAYDDAIQRVGAACDWLAFLDIDEFFVPVADRSLDRFLDRIDPYAAVSINWRCYGSSGVLAAPDGLITDTFLRRAEDGYSANHHVKSFVRPRLVNRTMNPHYFTLNWGDYVFPSGEPIQWGTRPGKSATVDDGSIARVNHYITRSKEHYYKKLAFPNPINDRRQDRFVEVDRNEVFDPIIPQQFPHLLESLRK